MTELLRDIPDFAADDVTEEAYDPLLAQDVVDGLTAVQKSLPSRWFYDDEGSRLFQRIMALPEYYLTRTEHRILRDKAAGLAECLVSDGGPLDLIELGSGDGEKTLSLCKALMRQEVDCRFYPIDVSVHALSELRARFATHLPGLTVQPLLGDYFERWPGGPEHRKQAALLFGSNLGNLNFEQSVLLLNRISSRLRPGDILLLGLDLKKDPEIILSAYNDRLGVTAEFNLNLLRRLNRELEMDFNLDQFSHFPTYSPLDGAARSFIVSKRHQIVHSRLLKLDFTFLEGETIYTEQSQKYSFASIDKLACAGGFEVIRHFTDDSGWYTVAALRVAGESPVRSLLQPGGWPCPD